MYLTCQDCKQAYLLGGNPPRNFILLFLCDHRGHNLAYLDSFDPRLDGLYAFLEYHPNSVPAYRLHRTRKEEE